jgi:hypothetical protein
MILAGTSRGSGLSLLDSGEFLASCLCPSLIWSKRRTIRIEGNTFFKYVVKHVFISPSLLRLMIQLSSASNIAIHIYLYIVKPKIAMHKTPKI